MVTQCHKTLTLDGCGCALSYTKVAAGEIYYAVQQLRRHGQSALLQNTQNFIVYTTTLHLVHVWERCEVERS